MEAKKKQSIISFVLTAILILIIDVLGELVYRHFIGSPIPVYISFPVNMGFFLFFFNFLFPRLFKLRSHS
jgi:hypothetical protein